MGVDRVFTHSWFHDFKESHSNDIEKLRAQCFDDLKANNSIQKVKEYCLSTTSITVDQL